MRKIQAGILLFLFITTVQPRQSEAMIPAVLAAGALGSLIVAGAAISYYKPASIPSSWGSQASYQTTSGSVARIMIGAQAAYSQYGAPQFLGGYVAAKAKVLDLWHQFADSSSQAVQANRAAYPSLYNYLLGPDAFPLINENSSVGTVGVKPNLAGVYYQVVTNGTNNDQYMTTTDVNGQYASYFSTGVWSGTTFLKYKVIGDYSPGWKKISVTTVYCAAVPKPDVHAKSTEDFQREYPGNYVPSSAVDDLDRVIANNPDGYGVSVVDFGSNPPAVADVDSRPKVLPPPPITATPPKVITETVTSKTTVSSWTAQAQAATQAVAQAQTAVDQYMANNPGATVGNSTALGDLLTTLDNAKKDQAVAQSGLAQAKSASFDAYLDYGTDPIKSLDFSKLNQLKDTLNKTWPFSLLPQVANIYTELTSEPIPPVFSIPMPMSSPMIVDLAPWDPLARFCRYLVGMFLTSGIVFYIVRFWRGVS